MESNHASLTAHHFKSANSNLERAFCLPVMPLTTHILPSTMSIAVAHD
nr:MAG TPA: hypothetical protein [Caudoviricetes sp.]